MTITEENQYWSKTFAGEDYSGLELKDKEFDGCNFNSCSFSEAIFQSCNFVDCEFTNCNLSLVKFNYSRLSDVAFTDCKLLGVDWTKVAWPNFLFESPVKFKNSIITDGCFYGLTLKELALVNCIANNVDFRSGSFSEANFKFTDFCGSTFLDTDLSNADFSDATNFDINFFNNNIKGARFDRFEAVRLLDCLEIELVG